MSGFGSDTSGNSVSVGRTWRYSFQWQEKKLSLSEKKREQERLEARGIQLTNRKRGDRKLPDVAEADILSSYVDVDDFIPTEQVKDLPSTSKNTATHLLPPDLTRQSRNKQNESAWTSNQYRAWLRTNREDKFRAMHIVALVEGVERVLCSMRFYKDTGLFCATPGFSDPIVDPETDPDLLLKGPKLTTYHLSTPSGSLYEYVLDNAHDLLSFASAEDQRLSREIRLQEEKRDIAEVTRWQLNRNPKLQPTITGSNNLQRKMMLSIEVVAVYNLQTTDPVLVEYELELPGHSGYSQWKLQPGNYIRKRGKTQMSIPQRTAFPEYLSAAHLGYHQRFNLTLLPSQEAEADKDANSLVPSPVFHLSVYSRDSWQRKRSQGHGEITLRESSGFYDFDVPIRKPIASIRDHMEELFLGIDESDEAFVGDRERNCRANSDESPISTIITSRLGQKSESTDTTVRIRFNIVDLQPSKRCDGADTTRLMQRPTATPFVNTRVVKRSVQEILQSVKLEKRLASITDPRIQAALRSLPVTGTESMKNGLL
ncbi:hypothetical protein P3T76_001322 [Phytophthora citrophthora]|uniref:Meckel syndrome type 1 protein n=1 Tax=Phytophthora citrophthora TaxID=4793 RepID=A0AAD9GYZ8_9STRA|nr:hypothetical protein P3T76_001322 [Phytophthora citrophthora]